MSYVPHPLPYPPAFRAETVRLVQSGGKSIPIIANDLGVTGNITAEVLSIHGLDGTIDAIGNTLKLQSLGTGSIDLLTGKVTIDEQGNIVAKGDITATKFNVDESGPASASIGNGTIKAVNTAIVISTKAVHTKSRISFTPEGKTGGQPL